jgi:arylsulfatase A-like enzyme
MGRSLTVGVALVLGCIGAWACASRDAQPVVAIQLVDAFTAERLVGRAAPAAPVAASEWRFASLAPGLSWSAGPGVEGLAVRDGLLVGRTSSDRAVVELTAKRPFGGGDTLHAVEVRLRATAGALLVLNSFPMEGGIPTAVFGTPDAPGGLSTPLLPAEGMRTYTFLMARSFAPGPLSRAAVQRLVLRPTDAPGAEFAVEHVRLVYRREHLATVPSGIGWRGLGEVYRESLVTRPGEVVRLPVRLPERPLLDLAVGTLAELPMTFRLAVHADGEETVVLRRTVTTADRWENDPSLLDRWAGDDVELELRAESEDAHGLAFWGSPVVRNRLTGAAAPGATAPQGVILVIADTLRKDHLDAWGYGRPTAPVLRRLAGEGTRFTDAVSQGVWTKVSVPSILSSVYPSAHGITDFADRLSASATTLAEAYRAAGHATFATSAIPFTGQLSNLHQGVEVLHEVGSFVPPNDEMRMKSAREYVGRTLEFIEQHREVPFLVVLHVADPHSPYRPFEPYDRMWSDPADFDWFRQGVDQVSPFVPATSPRRRGQAPTAEEMRLAGLDTGRFVRHEKGWYDGSIRQMDAEIGRLMERLGHLGLADRVVFAFLSDHGEEFLEHGSHWHGRNVYGENSGVPLILWGPTFLPRDREVGGPVQLIDVVPTLLELSGLPKPDSVQGESLLPLLRDGGEAQRRTRPAITERAVRATMGDEPGTLTGFALTTEQWRLVQHVPAIAGRPELELYDHRADPLDQRDVAAQHPEVVQQLAGELAKWKSWVREHRLPAEDATAVDATELARLRALGYIN